MTAETLSNGTRSVAAQNADYQAWLDAQPMTSRCAVDGCGWSINAPAGEARAAAKAHREQAHPDLAVQRRRRKQVLCPGCHIRHLLAGRKLCRQCEQRDTDRKATALAPTPDPGRSEPPQPSPQPASRASARARGSNLTPARILEARRLYHVQGVSLREIGRRHAREWGFGSPTSLANTLSNAGVAKEDT